VSRHWAWSPGERPRRERLQSEAGPRKVGILSEACEVTYSRKVGKVAEKTQPGRASSSEHLGTFPACFARGCGPTQPRSSKKEREQVLHRWRRRPLSLFSTVPALCNYMAQTVHRLSICLGEFTSGSMGLSSRIPQRLPCWCSGEQQCKPKEWEP
jgi:hypothetical protein